MASVVKMMAVMAVVVLGTAAVCHAGGDGCPPRPACPTSNLIQVKPRMAAPDFTANAVENETFVKKSLSDFRGQWAVLFFFPFGEFE